MPNKPEQPEVESAADDQNEGQETEKNETGLSDEKILSIIQGPLAASETFWTPYKDKYSRLENLYFGNIREDSPARDLQSQLSSGDAFELVETLLPRMIANKMRADLSGVEETDNEPAKITESILDWQMDTQWLEEHLEDWIRQATKTIGALQVDCEVVPVKTYRKKRKYTMTLPLVNKEVGIGPLVEVEETKEIFNHILETVAWDQLIVPQGTSMDKLPFIGKKSPKKIKDMTAEDGYKNIQTLKEKTGEAMFIGEGRTYQGDDLDQYVIDRGDQQDVNWENAEQMIVESEAMIYELYVHVDEEIYKVEYQPEYALVVKSEPLGNWHGMYPLRLLSLVPVENQAVGLSPLETAEPLIDAMDVWVNLLLEMGLFDVNRPMFYDKKTIGINYKLNPPRYRMGESIPVNGNPNNVIAVPQTPKIDGSHQWIMNWMRTRLQNKTGVTDYISGGDSVEQDQTLGAIRLKTAQSFKRFELNSKHVRRELSKVFFMMATNLQQYMPDNYPVRVLGKRGYQWRRIRSESIQGRFDFRIRGFDSIATEESEQIAKHRAMLQDAANPLVRPFINIYEIVKGLYEDGYKVGSNSRILITPQERLEDEDQAMQAQAMDADSENRDPQTAAVRPDDNHKVHLDVHMAFLKSSEFKKLPAPLQVMLARHIEAHRNAMTQGGQNGPMAGGTAPTAPGGPAGLQPPAPVSDLVPPSERKFTE